LTSLVTLLHGVSVYLGLTEFTIPQVPRMYPKDSGLAAWSENCRCHSSLPVGAVVSLFCESVFWVLPP